MTSWPGESRMVNSMIGCLENKSTVRHSNAKPHFRILAVVGCYNLHKADMRYLNERGNSV